MVTESLQLMQRLMFENLSSSNFSSSFIWLSPHRLEILITLYDLRSVLVVNLLVSDQSSMQETVFGKEQKQLIRQQQSVKEKKEFSKGKIT